jgi:hypothetical protein
MKTSMPLFAATVLLGSFFSEVKAQTPIITAQPANETVLTGSAVSFSVAVSGTGLFTYQWQFDGTNISGVITTVAGTGTGGYSGDGGAASSAELFHPFGVAVDASGNLFIGDEANNRVRELGTNGIITTVAGNGTEGGQKATPATAARRPMRRCGIRVVWLWTPPATSSLRIRITSASARWFSQARRFCCIMSAGQTQGHMTWWCQARTEASPAASSLWSSRYLRWRP